MIRDLTGQTAYQQRKAQFVSAWGDKDLSHQERACISGNVWPGHGRQSGDFRGCTVVFHWSFYLLLWLLPFFTYHMAITRIRNIAEHALVPDNDDRFAMRARPKPDGWRVFSLPPIGSIIMSSITSDVRSVLAIAGAQKALNANGFGERMETAPGYLSVLKSLRAPR